LRTGAFHQAKYSAEKNEAELTKGQAIDDYTERLAHWEDVCAAFTKAVDSVCKSIDDLAAMAGQVNKKRRALLAEHVKLAAEGIHAQPPRVAGKDTRMVLGAAQRGSKAATAAIGAWLRNGQGSRPKGLQAS
jgi:hypothetical protein